MKNPEDEKLVTKGAAKEGIRVWAKEHMGGEFIFPFDLMVAIDKLPAVSIKSPTETEKWKARKWDELKKQKEERS